MSDGYHVYSEQTAQDPVRLEAGQRVAFEYHHYGDGYHWHDMHEQFKAAVQIHAEQIPRWTRTAEEKAAIVQDFLGRFGDDLAAGELRPILHEVFPLERAPDAHRMLQASTHFGKVVLAVR